MSSPAWSPTTKAFAVALILFLTGLGIYLLRSLLPLLTAAFLIAYLLAPAVDWIQRRGIPRGIATAAIYFLILLPVIIAPASVLTSLIQQLQNVQLDVQLLIKTILDFLSKPLQIGGYTVQLDWLYNQLSRSLGDLVPQLAPRTVSFIVSVAGGFVEGFLILVFSSYFLIEAPAIVSWIYNSAPPGYQMDVEHLLKQINLVWNGFFRAQLIQAFFFGGLVTLVMAALGIRSALLLGAIAGLLEIAPRVGHSLSAFIGTAIVFFEGSTYIQIGNGWFALLVLVVYMALNELDSAYLLPNLIGRRVQLSPLIILLGIIAGAVIGGILGVILATPVIGTLRVLGRYVYSKLFDLPPYTPLPEEKLPQPRSWLTKPGQPSDPGGLLPRAIKNFREDRYGRHQRKNSGRD